MITPVSPDHIAPPASHYTQGFHVAPGAAWSKRMAEFMDLASVPAQTRIDAALADEPDFQDRCGAQRL